jgi:hypothetical protein
MPADSELLSLAQSVLTKHAASRDRAWDKRGTRSSILSQARLARGTTQGLVKHINIPSVPLSQALGDGTPGQAEKSGTELGTSAGQAYAGLLSVLKSERPKLIEIECWRQAIRDADCFLSTWGGQARAFGWTGRELFGLHTVPERPATNYRRLSRYDQTGLVWLLHGRPVVALTETTAAIQGATAIVTYRKLNKPALGPLGDSLDDFR